MELNEKPRDRLSFNGHEKQVTEGEQLKECIMYCKISQHFGLQNSICVCLPNSYLTDGSIEVPCDTNVTACSGDPFAFCGRENGRLFLSVYQKGKMSEKLSCEFQANEEISNNLAQRYLFDIGKETKSHWQDAFINCQHNNLSSFEIVRNQGNKIKFSGEFWLSNTRRWKPGIEGTRLPQFCVAARINTKGVVERDIRKCRDKLPGLCIENGKSSSEASSITSFTLPHNTKNLSRRRHTSPTYRRSSLSDHTTSAVSYLPKLAFVSLVESTTSLALKENIFPRYQKTASPGFQEITSQVLFESSSAEVPGTNGIDAKVIIAIITAVILVILVIIVTVFFCKRKRTTQFRPPNQPMTTVGKEVVYAEVNKSTVKREKSTASQRSQPTASNDTYDHMEHCRLSQTYNPTESNYDTMHSIGNPSEEENNYDHVTGTKMKPKQVIVYSATNYNPVDVEFHVVKDI
ncbi:unnamed protein product [Mytilus coruscus]|uniref:WSC domain-containing protein n=1 Tax=Mytilus coruscus TaxID=42192 RepID=A0A6J8AAE3_MYTCO|nr:unnamed protein product [Mytilus coruscus]